MNQNSARAKRRQRRKRTQRLVNVIAALLLVAGVIACVFAVRTVTLRKHASSYDPSAETAADDGETALEEETYQTTTERLEDTIEERIAAMPVEEKIAQLFIVSPAALAGEASATGAWEALHAAMEETPVGGFVYDETNFIDETQIKTMLSATKEMSRYPLFLVTMEQGGTLSALANATGRQTQPSAADTSSSGTSESALNAGREIGAYLREAGFNGCIGPCANIGAGEETKGVTYSADPTSVGEYATAFLRGLRENGLMSIVCDFPLKTGENAGGRSGETVSRRALNEMQDHEFLPFRDCITAGCEAVMLSNITAERVAGDNIPLSMSGNLIMGQLRSTIGFQGIVISAALNEDAVTGSYTAAQAALNAFDAGVDMLYLPEDFKAAYEALLDAAANGRITGERIDTSLRRIFRVKYREGFF